ncbi:hypothetical protein EDC61_102154 [Sulfuritortus calidifontis]|uniref:Serine aminopeptidase S33 domain-containing protein n=1 Tax=Sulfuritortus calidifontis TaxID=1914471 RepID=A0A4R3JY47_9PROT|nr:alpha/beta hydrolase [Sulfuritortus calidifontis]TCS73384.1 hypothetical protein EDC61_102154 [Sulfuritortus calidifontis]
MKRYKLRVKRADGGAVETVIEDPEENRRGLALIAHPHPLHGGSMDNKVVTTLARAAVECGYVAVRPNFRGVGSSDGEFDHGEGETEDLLAVAGFVCPRFGDLPLQLYGFSFGAYVQHRVARRLKAERLVMVGPAVSMYAFEAPAIRTDIIHGEVDELIPLAAVQAYAQQHNIPLHVIAGADHFFHKKLRALQEQLLALCQPHLA